MEVPFLIFVAAMGAVIGSFLNVVIYRVPEGLSVFSPARSFCPLCKTMLAWYDNIPVLGWFALGGKCRYCKAPISFQYPLVEFVCMAIFVLVYCVYYFTDLRPEFAESGLLHTWPALIVHLILIASLLAGTVIDAKMFIIPLSIPWFATIVALLVLPVSAALLPESAPVLPQVDRPAFYASIGGMIGLFISVVLLQMRILPQSFPEADPAALTESAGGEKNKPATAAADASGSSKNSGAASHAHDAKGTTAVTQDAAGPLVPALPDDFFVHPYPRWEIGKEILFLAPSLIGVAIGLAIVPSNAPELSLPLRVLGGVMWGYLVGAGLIWITRILGTLAFGKEAMGLGDVHFLAATGAALGWLDTSLVFFVAPFLGLAYAALTAMQRMIRGEVRVIPYGPYLAVGTLMVMLFRTPILHKLGIL